MDMRYDGTIAVAGRSDSRFAVAQFRPDGTLDTGFFGTGYNTTDLAGGSEAATGVAFSSDRIVLTGYNNVNNNYNIGLSRFETTAGTLDAPGQVVAKEFALTRLSPNPTRSETRIEFQLPRAAHVRIGVYDTQGKTRGAPRRRRSPGRAARGHLVAGRVAGNNAGGVYFVRFEAGGGRGEQEARDPAVKVELRPLERALSPVRHRGRSRPLRSGPEARVGQEVGDKTPR